MTSIEETCELLCLDLPKAESLRGSLPELEVLEASALRAKALSDPSRLGIAMALDQGGELCVCDLSWVVGRQDKIVSHHVRLLRNAGLASSRKDGRMVLYSLTKPGVDLLRAVAGDPQRAMSV
jgi:DNA-binding transcriptional ArsR family regulator